MACYAESKISKYRTSVSLLLKLIAAASFDKLKEEIKVAMADGAKLVLAIDAWTGGSRRHLVFL
jgi:hypothetical protein